MPTSPGTLPTLLLLDMSSGVVELDIEPVVSLARHGGSSATAAPSFMSSLGIPGSGDGRGVDVHAMAACGAYIALAGETVQHDDMSAEAFLSKMMSRGAHGVVALFDASTHELLRRVTLVGELAQCGLTFTPDGSRLVVALSNEGIGMMGSGGETAAQLRVLSTATLSTLSSLSMSESGDDGRGGVYLTCDGGYGHTGTMALPEVRVAF